MAEGVFCLKGGKNLTKLEVWDYKHQKRAATLLIKKFNPRKTFEAEFQKSNLKVEISKPVVLTQSCVSSKENFLSTNVCSRTTKSSGN